jgi:RNA polymerase sigma factor (sigma-70 family)
MTSPSRPGALEPDEDARLVGRCLEGDAHAWAILVSRHERLVFAIGRSYRLSDPDLGDVFQEVFAALVRGLPRLRDARSLVRWLSSTTERIARATALRRRREQAMGLADPEALESLPADQPAVEAELEILEEQAMVRLALSALPEGCRRLLTALYYEDPTPDYSSLSRRLGVPIGSLGPTRARCIERLRRILAGLVAPRAGISEPPTPTSPAGGPHPPDREIRRSHGSTTEKRTENEATAVG